MDSQTEKIYVAVGSDLQDGFKTLDWALRKWNSQPISIVILHATDNVSKDYVYTPFGKLPARSVNDELLEVLKKQEQEKMNKLKSKYITHCGKLQAEILDVEKFDERIQKRIIDLIFGLQITKLVIGFSFMKSSWKSRGAISGLFYVHQHKPDFCELFVICGGKQVFLKGKNDEKIMEDDNGMTVARMRDKITFKDWIEKIFTEKPNDCQDAPRRSSNSLFNGESPVSQNQWEFYLQEIENYFQELLSASNLEEEGSCGQQESDISQISPIGPDFPEHNVSNTNDAEKIEMLKAKLKEAQNTIQLKRKEAKEQLERHAKAEWAICLCNSRVEDLESKMKEEISTREELEKELEVEKEQIFEIKSDVEENRRKLGSLAELQSELSNKLQISMAATSRAETQLEKAVNARTEMVREIEELRRQRDVLNRRIEFCKEKDAIGMAARMSESGCSFREYTAEEIRLATDNFSDRLRLKSGGDWTNVYRGRVNHFAVAIKMLDSVHGLSSEDFQAKVKLLSDIRQPHVVAMVGFCTEPKCIVYEYMHHGSLEDMLFCGRRNRALRWHDRIRIAAEVCSALGFLHAAQPRPVVHCPLNPSNVLLDRNHVAKIIFGFSECRSEGSVESDIRALGLLMLQLLTGRNWAGLVEKTTMMDKEALVRALDDMAGPWPLDLAKELAGLAIRCMSIKSEPNGEMCISIGKVREELDEMRRKGSGRVGREGKKRIVVGAIDREDSSDVPSVFLCPILQEVMKNPHVAADGFSYELEAIEEWLQSGHDTSPMTNLRLKHRFVTPNHSLRSLIEDWQSKRPAN